MKNRIAEILKRNEIILILFIIFIMVVAVALNYVLAVEDDLWNFSNIYKMVNGFKIYRDINVIVTPLFFYLGEILFKILGSNFLTLKIYNILIFVILYILIYLILNEMKISRRNKIIYVILIYFLTYNNIIAGANYTMLAFVFFLLGVLLILKDRPSYWQGIIIFLILMTKQNIGIYYFLAYIAYIILQNKDIKMSLKIIIKPVLILLLISCIYIGYLLLDNNLYNFINMTILGITEFGSKNFAFDNAIFRFSLVTIILLFSIWLYKYNLVKLEKEDSKKIKELLCFSVMCIPIAYPIINSYHTIVASILPIITFIIICDKSFIEQITNKKIFITIKNVFIILFTVFIGLFCALMSFSYINKQIKYDYFKVYYGAVITDELKENVNEIIKYIQDMEKGGKQVKIVSYYSNLYMNVLNRNNGIMDLPFYGNMGKDGENKLINKINKFKNTNVLILKDGEDLIQESLKVRNYIKDNYEKIGEIEMFEIYKVGY